MARNKLIARLQKVAAEVDKQIKQVDTNIEEIANDALFIAQSTIEIGSLDKRFTQKHGAELAQYIELKKQKNGNYQLIAGENATDEIRYELYYAEYGAGLDGRSTNIPSNYTPHGGTRYFKSHPEIWVYPLAYTHYVVTPKGKDGKKNYGMTDTSIPLGYMQTARNYAKDQIKNLKFKSKKKLKTTIKRGIKNAIEE